MSLRALTRDQVDRFIETGYVRLEAAIPRKRALAVQGFIWQKLAERGIDRDDPSTWTEAMPHVRESYRGEPFDACQTERLRDAIEDLVGEGRWRERDGIPHWGWWPVNFHVGADRPWDVPTNGWHWDGQHFEHFIDSPDQGLLLLCMFSDTGSRGGATLVAEGSHEVTARYLAGKPSGVAHGDGISECKRGHPWLTELTGIQPDDGPVDPYAESHPEAQLELSDRIGRFMETTTIDAFGTKLRVAEAVANAGDVYLCHPFLWHSASQNHSGVPRFMCNRTTPLKDRMNPNRNLFRSPVEESIHRAVRRDLVGREQGRA